MQQYVARVRWTEQGIAQVKDTVQRFDQGRQTVERLGGQVTAMFWTQGRYDMVFVFQAPDDETAGAIMLGSDIRGFLRSETMRAFGGDAGHPREDRRLSGPGVVPGEGVMHRARCMAPSSRPLAEPAPAG